MSTDRRGSPTRRYVIAAHAQVQQPPFQFIIRVGQESQEVTGRKAAVRAAKETSSQTGRPVGLERADGRVKMQFQRGSLQTYRYDTHDGRG